MNFFVLGISYRPSDLSSLKEFSKKIIFKDFYNFIWTRLSRSSGSWLIPYPSIDLKIILDRPNHLGCRIKPNFYQYKIIPPLVRGSQNFLSREPNGQGSCTYRRAIFVFTCLCRKLICTKFRKIVNLKFRSNELLYYFPFFRYNVYVVMFYKVLQSFVFFLAWYAFFIIAFGLAFYILLHKGGKISEVIFNLALSNLFMTSKNEFSNSRI